MLDIADEIDAAIGAPPPGGPDVDHTLVLGRRALLRQRMAYGAGAAACALVVAGAAWSVSGGDAGVRSDDPGFGDGVSGSASAEATDPTDVADPTRSMSDSLPWHGEAARIDRQGRLEVKPGWTVTQDLSTRAVTAVEVSKGPRRMWYLFGRGVTFSPGGTAPGYASFQAWVDVNIPILRDMQDPPDAAPEDEWPGEARDDLVRFAPKYMSCCVLLPVDDSVRIVEERVNPDLPDSFATDADRSAVAVVEKDGERWYVSPGTCRGHQPSSSPCTGPTEERRSTRSSSSQRVGTPRAGAACCEPHRPRGRLHRLRRRPPRPLQARGLRAVR